MRIEIVFLATSLTFLTISAAQAAQPTPKAVLSIIKKGRYSNETTVITKQKNQWVCKTELSPFTVDNKQPFESSTLAALGKDLGRPEERIPCRDHVAVVDSTHRKPKTYKGCADEPMVAKLLEETARSCGRL